MTTVATADIAQSLGLSEQELVDQALKAFLREKKLQVLRLQLEILARYHVESPDALAAAIAEAEVHEHPAWEDLIVAENLQARLERINEYLEDLQRPVSHRAG